MKHIDEYRDGNLARCMAATITREAVAGRHYQFMEFCGGHTHAISRYGIEDLMPANVQMVHGPGCPVCVLPIGRIDDGNPARHAAGGHAMHLRRSDACTRLRWRQSAQGQGRGRRHPHGLFHAGRDPHRRDGARPRGRVLRDRLRDDYAAHRNRNSAGAQETVVELQRVLQPTSSPRPRCGQFSARRTPAPCGSTASSVPRMSARSRAPRRI